MLHQIPHHPIPQSRESSLDFLRGVAVFLMILSHAIFFFHNDSNAVLRILGRTGNIACFTIFLFVSGAAIYHGYLKHETEKLQTWKVKVFKRSVYFLLMFYFVALLIAATSFKNLPAHDILVAIKNILLLQNLPSFTEFFIPFVLFSFSILFFKKIYHRMAKSLLTTLALSAALFFAGYLLYPLAVSSPFREIKSLFVGSPGLMRYPLFQYAPIFLFGIFWGHFLEVNPLRSHRDAFALRAGIVFAAIVLFTTILTSFYPLVLLNPLKRWPPSIGFLSIGLALAFLLEVIYSITDGIRRLAPLFNLFQYMGRDAADLFVVHISLLAGYAYFIHRQFANPLLALDCFVLLLFLSILGASLNWKFSPSIFTVSLAAPGMRSRYKPRKRYLLTAIGFTALVLFNLNRFPASSTIGESIEPSELYGSTLSPLSENDTRDIIAKQWFDEQYGFCRQITFVNEDHFGIINHSEDAQFSLDHQALSTAQRSAVSGNDLLLVYYGKDGAQTVPITIENPSSTQTTIHFQIQENVPPQGSDNRYFLYYGSDFPQNTNVLGARYPTSVQNSISVGNENQQTALVSINRKWHLKSLPETVKKELLTLSVFVKNPALLEETTLAYDIPGTPLAATLTKTVYGTYQATIDTTRLPVGEYAIHVSGRYDGAEVSCRRVAFFVSEPVYVAWTFDWEGQDVSQSYLSTIENQAHQHSIPLTHFFNPRIYLSSTMTPERAQELTQWVKKRQQENGDEIELHLHMHVNIMEALGITPKKEPKWGKSSDGYDVYTTAYSETELATIIQWAKEQFSSHGLGNPIGYRAGGWFADRSTLSVLAQNGFLFDASGREKDMWKGVAESPWNLTSQTQPYYPSRLDQNATSPDHFSVLEIPDNGADSWAYSGDELRQRFLDNFSGKPVAQKKAVTFLSHPHWYDIDQPKMDTVLTTTDSYLYQKDRGPVMYTTLKTIYDVWK